MAKIVWIEDDVDVIDRTVWRVEAAGHQVVRLRSMAEARERLEEVRAADLILLDLITPEGAASAPHEFPGIVLLQEFRAGVRCPPVVILSWVHRDDVFATCRGLQVADIIQKPVSPSHLEERLEAVLANSPAGAP